jgi:hypothetical protein
MANAVADTYPRSGVTGGAASPAVRFRKTEGGWIVAKAP